MLIQEWQEGAYCSRTDRRLGYHGRSSEFLGVSMMIVRIKKNALINISSPCSAWYVSIRMSSSNFAWCLFLCRDVDDFHLEKQKHLKFGSLRVKANGPLRGIISTTCQVGRSLIQIDVGIVPLQRFSGADRSKDHYGRYWGFWKSQRPQHDTVRGRCVSLLLL